MVNDWYRTVQQNIRNMNNTEEDDCLGCWIDFMTMRDRSHLLIYHDRLTGVSVLRLLREKNIGEIMCALSDVFRMFGVPPKLQIENDRTLTRGIVRALRHRYTSYPVNVDDKVHEPGCRYSLYGLRREIAEIVNVWLEGRPATLYDDVRYLCFKRNVDNGIGSQNLLRLYTRYPVNVGSVKHYGLPSILPPPRPTDVVGAKRQWNCDKTETSASKEDENANNRRFRNFKRALLTEAEPKDIHVQTWAYDSCMLGDFKLLQ